MRKFQSTPPLASRAFRPLDETEPRVVGRRVWVSEGARREVGPLWSARLVSALRCGAPLRRLGPISNDAMVLAFLKAEVDSRLYGARVRGLCERRGRDRRLIDEPDLADVEANQLRRDVLGDFRGFGRDALLFANFPADVAWSRARLSVHELGETKYAGWPNWVKLTHGTRLVAEGAKNAVNPFYASEELRKHVPAIEEAWRAGVRFPELIFVGRPDFEELVLLEGHKRATAYVRVLDPADELEVILGSSEEIDRWRGWRAFLAL